MHTVDPTSYELGAIRLTLRRDLAFRRQAFAAQACYLIEDAATSRFFRIGLPEYTFVSLLDGRTSLADAVAETATRLGSDAFTETQAAALASWLVQNGLASTAQSVGQTRLIDAAQTAARQRRREWLNPLMLKLPLGNPDPLVRQFSPLAAWWFSAVGLLVWLIVGGLGANAVWTHWQELTSATAGVLSPDNWIWLGISWLGLKAVHESAHAVACRRFGGETREAGLLMLLFVPLPYVDVTSAWRFGSKWQRIAVSAAGMYAELFVAAVAALVWTQTGSPLVQHHAINIIITAGLMTLLFNINPLMRFDGYYILTDLLELPNLATHGQQDLLSLARRWLLGIDGAAPQWPEGRGAVVRLYGLAAFVWRITICVSLTLAAELLYHGAGIVLAAVAVLLWVVLPLAKVVRYLVVGDPVNPPHRLRFAGICAGAVAVGFLVWNHVPYVETLQLPAVVDYDPIVTLRAGAAGFVREVLVAPGTRVAAGSPLLILENEPLAARVRETELAIEQSQLDATRFHRQGKLAAFQVELENEAALQLRLDELREQTRALTILAPTAGTVLTRDLGRLEGRWVRAGTELLALGNPAGRSLHVAVPQSEIDRVRLAVGEPVGVHIWGTGTRDATGRLVELDPRGSTALRHPALAAIAGGSLAVRPARPQDAASSGPPGDDWELLEPHFNGRVALDSSDLSAAGTGQTGIVEIRRHRGSVGDVLTARLVHFLDERQTHQ